MDVLDGHDLEFILIFVVLKLWLTQLEMFLGDRFQNGSRYTIGPLSCTVCPVCPVCLSVTLVYCGQTVGWIKMKLGMEVGLRPGHTVLYGDPATQLPQKTGAQTPLFGPCPFWPNG